jgi:hypothetical protein
MPQIIFIAAQQRVVAWPAKEHVTARATGHATVTIPALRTKASATRSTQGNAAKAPKVDAVLIDANFKRLKINENSVGIRT